MKPLGPLVAQIRKATPAGVWSAGVKTARAGAVALEEEGTDEIVLRVRTPGRAVAPTVVLYPGELEWDCDCPGKMRPCEHVVAAALALVQDDPAQNASNDAPGATEAGGVGETTGDGIDGDGTKGEGSASAGTASAAPAGTTTAGATTAGATTTAAVETADPERALSPSPPTLPSAPSGASASLAARSPALPTASAASSASVAPARAALALGPPRPGLVRPGGPSVLAARAQSWGRIAYRFSRAPEGLRVERAIVRADPSAPVTPLVGTLSSLLARPAERDRLQPEESDLRADQLLGAGSRGVLPPSKLEALLRILTGSRQITLEGQPVAISQEVVGPRALVQDRGDDVVVTLLRDPRVTDVVSPGVALLDGESLAFLGETELTGAYLQHLPLVRRYAPAQMGELATRLLPDLSRRMVVEVQSRRVPPIVRDLVPRVSVDLSHLGSGLSVLATLVYGAPPVVRIDEGRMVHLRGPVPVRDEAAERRLLERLRAELELLPGRRATLQPSDVPGFVKKLERWRGDLVGDAASVIKPRAHLEPRIAFAPGSASGEVASSFTFDVIEPGKAVRSVDAESVMRAWQDGLGLVPLDGGGWASLPQDFLAKHGATLLALLEAREPDGHIAAHARGALAALCRALDTPAPAELSRLAPLAADFDHIPSAPLPADLRATLRPYQKAGVDWLCFLRQAGLGGLLADDMGLGKTLQAMCALAKPALVVAPTSVLPNWRAELARFRPDLKVALYHGAGRELDEAADVVVTTYALLRLDAERLAARRWATVVLDEAQAIKNPESQTARAACGLSADFRVALSGTPVENRLEELWSLMHFLNRGLLGGRRSFDENVARPIAQGDASAQAALRARLRPFVLRRLKREVAPELPPRTEAVLHVALDERERGLYDTVRAASRKEVLEMLAAGGGVMAALEALLRLRQAACHPALLPGQKAESSSKLDLLRDSLSTAAADGHKALVFSQWTSLLDLIEPQLQKAELPFLRLDGSTRDRGEVVERFQSPDGPPVLLVSLKAGGAGLNLTAADHVFLCDPWWNPAVEAQAADRAHRIGQDKPVFVYRLVATDTVEERILELQARKKALADAALDGGAAAQGLTRDDLLALLA